MVLFQPLLWESHLQNQPEQRQLEHRENSTLGGASLGKENGCGSPGRILMAAVPWGDNESYMGPSKVRASAHAETTLRRHLPSRDPEALFIPIQTPARVSVETARFCVKRKELCSKKFFAKTDFMSFSERLKQYLQKQISHISRGLTPPHTHISRPDQRRQPLTPINSTSCLVEERKPSWSVISLCLSECLCLTPQMKPFGTNCRFK